ncbi:MAG: hypothetical protein MJ134_04055 [Lachnospiraceae bacterium]|nr:hypothetical protein [Lachnospiraceae bacterium]
MDKQEYKLRSEQIKDLIGKRDFFGAVKIADSIDWNRVRSVSMLCTVSDLYKATRNYKRSKDLLLLAYDRHPNGRMIVYSLCELSIKLGDVVDALEYYKTFLKLAPQDSGKYVLQYKIYEAQDVSLEERIAVLEQLKKNDYREKWGYELATLYHRVGLATACVEECDELILWFSDGRYVKKAMELKMLHKPLSAKQQDQYDIMTGKKPAKVEEAPEPVVEETKEEEISPVEVAFAEVPAPVNEPEELDIQVKPVNVGKYDTINLQKALAENLQEILQETEKEEAENTPEPVEEIAAVELPKTGILEDVPEEEPVVEAAPVEETQSDEAVPSDEEETAVAVEETPSTEEESVVAEEEIAPAEESISVEAAVAVEEPVEESAKEPVIEPVVQPVIVPVVETSSEKEDLLNAKTKEIFFNDTSSMPSPLERELQRAIDEERKKQQLSPIEEILEQDLEKLHRPSVEEVMKMPLEEVASYEYPPEEIASMLSEGYDGQISMVVEGKAPTEKQITGQMNIDEILAEWEKTKKLNEEKRRAEDLKRVFSSTGCMFSKYDVIARDGILEQLEREGKIKALVKVEQIPKAPKIIPEEELAKETVVSAEEAEEEESNGTTVQPVAEATVESTPSEEPAEVAATEAVETVETPMEEESAEDALEIISEGVSAEEVTEVPAAEEVSVEEPVVEETSEESEEEPVEETPVESTEEPVVTEEPAEIEAVAEEAPVSVEEETVEAEEAPATEVSVVSEEVAETVTEVEAPAEVAAEEETTEVSEEDQAEETVEDTEEPEETEEEETESSQKAMIRELTEEERVLFAPFIQTRGARKRFVTGLDQIELEAAVGNAIVTGNGDSGTVELAKNVMKDIQLTNSKFSGKIAKITGTSLNSKNVELTIAKLGNGGLIIEKASGMTSQTVQKLVDGLQNAESGIVVILEDNKKSVKRMLAAYPHLKTYFPIRLEVEELNDDALASYGKQYAEHLEYAIDDMGMLALHTRISDMQTSEHIVTVAEVREIVDAAIARANKKNIGHLFDVMLGKRYDDDDMIVLREKDFME